MEHRARNIEIKARVLDVDRLRSRALTLASGPPERLRQIDTFFTAGSWPGRLKVREFADGSGEIIAYNRSDRSGPKTSTYTRVSCKNAQTVVAILGRVLRRRGIVVKNREVIMIGRTRVHLDDVEGLGTFVELEVVLTPEEPIEAGEREARELMVALNISADHLTAGAYIDLLEAQKERS